MSDPHALETKFWKALQSDRTVMLGLAGGEDGHTRPMTAQVEGDGGPVWFFTSTDNALAARVSTGSSRAVLAFASKGHDLFASVQGTLSTTRDRAVIDRLWNAFVAAWYEHGKDDPKLVLLRLDPDAGEIWLNENSVFAGLKMLVGVDPKKDYRDKVAKVDLR